MSMLSSCHLGSILTTDSGLNKFAWRDLDCALDHRLRAEALLLQFPVPVVRVGAPFNFRALAVVRVQSPRAPPLRFRFARLCFHSQPTFSFLATRAGQLQFCSDLSLVACCSAARFLSNASASSMRA